MTDRPPLPYPWREVRQRLQRDLGNVLAKLKLDGASDGERMYPLNPRRNDRKAGSFVIWLKGDRAGGYRDYAVNGVQGDILGLIEYICGHRSKIDAYWWALEALNLGRGVVRSKEQARQDEERLAADRAAEAAKQDAASQVRAEQCFKLWLTLPPIVGTIAETYLRQARGIPLDRLKHQPGALRYAEAAEWIDAETGEVFTWRHCMVSAMTRGKRIVALHRTFLKPDGSGKREGGPNFKAKTMIGPVKDGQGRGAAIRLSAGPSGLSPTEAEKRGKIGPLAVGEGIETSLSVACARPDLRVWAAGSLSLMGLLDWPACASAVVLLRDNDWKPEAMDAFARVEAHWRAQAAGRPLHVAAPPKELNDFNDWARAA